MKNNTITIMKKELARFFGDRRMVFTTILMPGLLIYLVYTFVGNGMMQNLMPAEDYRAKAYIQNMPDSLSEELQALPVDWNTAMPEDMDVLKQAVQDKEADGLVIFPRDFDQAVADYRVESGETAPNVEIYYNSTETESERFYEEVTAVLENYEAALANKLDVNAGDLPYDCATQKDMTGQVFSMMLPMLLMIFLYSGCAAVAPESIAGEKERGTIATLLVTPVKRSALALGKVFSLSIIALLAGFSSFIGTFSSLPALMGGAMTGIDQTVYGPMDYVMLLGVILSTVLILISAISLISAFAKSVKEAGTAVSPMMIVVMFLSMLPMFDQGKEQVWYGFLIPLYNSVQCMNGIFSFHYEPVQILLTMASNLVCAGVLVYGLTRVFHSEKIML